MQMRLLRGLQDLPAPMQIGKRCHCEPVRNDSVFLTKNGKGGYFLVSSSRVFFRFWRICS